LLVEDSELL
jgi:DNA repair exonuclease SbcCD ATPase subunit